MLSTDYEPSSLAKETYGLTIRREYKHLESYPDKFYKVEEENRRWKSLASFFETAFLPHGFPDSVSDDYLQYQLWDSIQAFASSINGSIATHAVLKGIGVGDESTSVLTATLTWIVKDGTSMVGRILFAWSRGTQLDCECKKWRLFADILNDIAMFLEIITTFFKGHFQIILYVSSLFKSIVGVAGGATRAALTEHQARQNNMADVSAKDGSQETMVNLAALICSLIILPYVTQNYVLMWLIFVLMTTIHLFANYYAVKSVVMETFNAERFRIVTEHYLQTNQGQILSISEANKRESVFLLPLNRETAVVRLGVSLDDTIREKSYPEFMELLNIYQDEFYILTVSFSSSKTAVINVTFHEQSTVRAHFKAMFQSSVISHLVSCTGPRKIQSPVWQSYEIWEKENQDTRSQEVKLQMFSKMYVNESFDCFMGQIRNHGWATDSAMFDVDNWRATWKSPENIK